MRPVHDACRGRDIARQIAAGVPGGNPSRHEPVRQSARRCGRPCRRSSSCLASASACQSMSSRQLRPFGVWPVTKRTDWAQSRWVSETPSDAAMASAEVMPGTTRRECPRPRAARSPRRRGRRSSGRRDFSRTTCLPALASDTIMSLMSSCRQLSRPPRLPTSMRFASRRASSSTSSETRSSNRMTSAACSARTALRVSSSASPGPAPTSVTRPFWRPARRQCETRFGDERLRRRPCEGAGPKARSTKRSQKARRCATRGKPVRRPVRGCRARAPPIRRGPAAAASRSAGGSPGRGSAPRRRSRCRSTTGERLTIEPNWKSQIGRLVDDIDRHAGGARLRGTPRLAVVATSATASTPRQIVGGPRASHDRACAVRPSQQIGAAPRSVSTAQTRSTCAPAAASSSAFQAAASDPPATTARLPVSSTEDRQRGERCASARPVARARDRLYSAATTRCASMIPLISARQEPQLVPALGRRADRLDGRCSRRARRRRSG